MHGPNLSVFAPHRKGYMWKGVRKCMPDVKESFSNVPGVQDVFLIVDNRIVLSTFVEDVTFLLRDLSLITEALKEKYGTVKKLAMSGDRNLFFFYHKNMILGIETDQTVSLPLLNMQVRFFFKRIDENK